LFQENAWVDGTTAVSIANLYLRDPAFAENRNRLFLCDNLDGHLDDRFLAIIRKLGRVENYPANLTAELQPST
jgi:hypothetical protein